MTALIIFGAKHLIAFVAAGSAVAVAMAREQRTKLLYVLAVALPLSYALARLAGLLYGHQQPFAEEGFSPLIVHEVDNAFPSDHTVIGGVFASVAFLADRRVGLVLWALTLLVGLSRMIAGLHYGIDIAVGAVLAVVAVWVAYRVLKICKVY